MTSVSVIITAYNESKFIQEAIRSVLSQSRAPDEILLVDGGSEDETPRILREFAQEHQSISCLLLEGDTVIPEMRNQALREISGDLVCFLDGDDRFRPQKLETEMQIYSDKQEKTIVFSNFAYIDTHGKVIDVWSKDADVPTGYVLQENAARNWPQNSLYRNALVPVKSIKQAGMYDESLLVYEDWDMKIRTAKHNEVVYCPQILTEYRRHQNGISNRSSAQNKYKASLAVYEKSQPMLKEELTPAALDTVLKKMQSYVLQHGISAAREQNCYPRERWLYLKWISLDMDRLFNIKSHAIHLLPPSIKTVLSPVYSAYRRGFTSLKQAMQSK